MPSTSARRGHWTYRPLPPVGMGGSRGIPQYSWEYPTIFVHFYVDMCIYLYIYECIMI